MEEHGFLVTIRSQPKHGLLYAALKSYGSLEKMCAATGFCKVSLSRWINLRGYPTSAFPDTGRCVEKRRASLDIAVKKHLGISLDECWPPEVRKFIDRNRHLKSLVFEQTQDVPLPRLSRIHESQLSIEYDPSAGIQTDEQRARIKVAMKALSYRESEVIKLRYGLTDGITYSLDEVAQIFKVTRERIRQIELNAIRKLRDPCRSHILIDL